MTYKGYYFWLIMGLVTLFGCTTLPEQPTVSGPYALLTFPASIRLLALDEQSFETPTRIDAIRVPPGQHILRFVHVNAGIDGSAEHAGQLASPFTVEVHEGLVYQFESKT